MFTVAAYQGPVVFGDAEANVSAMMRTLHELRDHQCLAVCFPETFLHGYFPSRDRAWENSVDLGSADFASVCERLAEFRSTILFGLNERRGDKLYNTVVVVEQGRLVGKYSKNYLVYDYFERGHDFPVFERNGVKFGIIICADSSYVEPARILAMRGAQVIFSPHFNYINYEGLDDHTRRVRNHHVARAVENDVYVVRSNVIVKEHEGFPVFERRGVGVGDSFILNRRGKPVAEAGLSVATTLVHSIPRSDLAGAKRPFHRTDRAIARALADEYAKFAAQ